MEYPLIDQSGSTVEQRYSSPLSLPSPSSPPCSDWSSNSSTAAATTTTTKYHDLSFVTQPPMVLSVLPSASLASADMSYTLAGVVPSERTTRPTLSEPSMISFQSLNGQPSTELSTDAFNCHQIEKRARRRRAFACDVCRQRKVRCDLKRPTCTSCVKYNMPCAYEAAEAGALAAAAKASNRRKAHRIRKLSVQGSHQEPYLSTSHIAQNTLMPANHSADTTLLASAAKVLYQTPELSVAWKPTGESVVTESYRHSMASSLPSPPTTGRLQSALEVHSDQNSDHQHGGNHYADGEPSSSPSSLQLSSLQTSTPMLPNQAMHNPIGSALQAVPFAGTDSLPAAPPILFPDTELVQQLVTLYMTHVFPYSPLFTIGWLRNEIANGLVPAALTLGMMAVGARFAPMLVHSNTMGRALLEQPQHWLQQTRHTPSLYAVQTSLLVSLYLFGEGRDQSAMVYRLDASRMTQSLAGNMSIWTPRTTGTDRNQADWSESWRRVCRVCFLADRLSAVATQGPFDMDEPNYLPSLLEENIPDVVDTVEGLGLPPLSVLGNPLIIHSRPKAPLPLEPGLRHSRMLQAVTLLGRIAQYERQSRQSVMGQDNLLTEAVDLHEQWRRMGASLPTFETILSSVDSLISPTFAPLNPMTDTPFSRRLPPTPVASNHWSLENIQRAMHDVFIHATHSAAYLLLLQPPSSDLGLWPMHSVKVWKRRQQQRQKQQQQQQLPPRRQLLGNSQISYLEALSLRLKTALEIIRLGRRIPVEAIPMILPFYLYCLAMAGDVLLDLLADRTSWSLMDPYAALSRLAQVTELLGQLSQYWGFSELHRIRLVERLWGQCDLLLSQARLIPALASLLNIPAMQSTHYPGAVVSAEEVKTFLKTQKKSIGG